MNPRISIIVPCYNQAEYLDECLQTVLEQTYQSWECIIVNDGSPDNTEEVAKKWVEKDNRFKYLYKVNGGLSSARNAGIEIANGEWILPLDCDDKIGDQYLKLAEEKFNNGYTVIYCKAEFFGTAEESWKLVDYNYDHLLRENLIFCTAFFKKEDWKISNGYDSNLIYGKEDWDFWLSILDEKKNVLCLDYLGFFYRRKDESMDVEINQNKTKKDFSLNYIYKKHLEKYLPKDMNAIDNFIQQRNIGRSLNFYNEIVNKNTINKFLFKLINKTS
ncbi:glycosyltransferase family 2 protein [Chryseobacterium polytrichastri]|uniref:Glycosyltransferase involved in cell wall bisynthesis n=1 Tax=Chryseobacterium polytrichastri TaxID=1302687 RepID=A0A1M6X8E5_9FLAO|nr:glycosyltransferase family A protein [Chryseobacterium polytrichastri]SHL02204.1 Glycosyltransferase involved in cell wall bisynthesis [Chryseobacterium polytrichastri]